MQRYLLTLYWAILVVLFSGWGVSAYAACPPFPGTDASQSEIEAWADQCEASAPHGVTGGGVNSCTNRDAGGNPTLVIWGYTPTYRYEKLLRQGTNIDCPPDESATSENEANLYWTDGNIHITYTPCNNTPVLDSTQPSGYRCDGGAGATESYQLSAGSCQTEHNMDFCAEKQGNMLCAYVLNGATKIYIGCNGVNPHISAIDVSLACFMPTVCTSHTTGLSHNPLGFSLSGTLVLCFEGAIQQLFFGNDGGILDPGVALDYHSGNVSYTADGHTVSAEDFYAEASCGGSTMFTRVQDALKSAVTAALVLYIVFWGMKVMVSGQPTSRGEFIKNIVVYSIVVYFSIGDGWREYYPLLKQLITGFSVQMLRGNLNAYGASTNPCIFDVNSYPVGLGSMALWDMLDCKVINYLFSGKDYPKILLLGVMAIINYPTGIVLFIFIIIFSVFISLILLFTLQIYVISLITIALLMFISPLIIPMVLFSYTKGYFSKWLEELISVSLYPVVMVGFVSVMLTTFDRFYYGDPDGTETVYASTGSGHLFTSCDENSFGCQLDKASINADVHADIDVDVHADIDIYHADADIGVDDADADIDAGTIDNFDIDAALIQLLRVCLFAFLFYKFTEILPAFLAELTGSAKTNLGDMAMSPSQMFNQ